MSIYFTWTELELNEILLPVDRHVLSQVLQCTICTGSYNLKHIMRKYILSSEDLILAWQVYQERSDQPRLFPVLFLEKIYNVELFPTMVFFICFEFIFSEFTHITLWLEWTQTFQMISRWSPCAPSKSEPRQLHYALELNKEIMLDDYISIDKGMYPDI